MILSVLLAAPAALSPAQDAAWPSFRGPAGNGVVAAHPLRWNDEENLAWKVEVPGGGWSSPVVVEDRVFVTTAVQPDKEGGGRPLGFMGGVRMPESRGGGAKAPEKPISFQVRAYSLGTGELIFEKELASRAPEHGIHPCNTYATESPATDGERVVCYFGAIGLVACVDLEGELVWEQELGMFEMNADFGTGSALAIGGGNVFVQNDNNESSFVAAFRLEDGEEAWRVERPKGTAWASPTMWTHGDATDLVVCGPDAVTGYAPESGEVRWRVEGIGGTFSASAAAAGDRLIFGNSAQMRRGPLIAIKDTVDGVVDVDDEGEESPVLWNIGRAGPGFSSPVTVNGLVWVANSQGILTCRDATTGEELYDERLPGLRNVVSCPWTDGEHVFVLSEGGTTVAVKAAREFEIVATNEVEGIFWGTPSAAGGSLLLRSADSLICVRGEG